MSQLFKRAGVAVFVGLLLGAPAWGILIRPDRPDRRYLELAAKYPASVCLDLPDGEATLVAPRWLLTAAHLAKDIKTGDASAKITIGKREYRVEKVIPHPDYKSAKSGGDLALVKLTEAVTDIQPVPIYRGTGEMGKITTIVGHGYSGTLVTGPAAKDKWDKKKRAATNKIERIMQKKWLLFIIDVPEKATDLEGGGGPGDSGGPAFIEEDGKLYVAGVSCFTDDANDDKIIGNYGDREAYTRVSAFADWIDKIINAK
ncbi:hypothetical protein BH10PLA2_BH10PLA2_38880 [soil metagenome]